MCVLITHVLIVITYFMIGSLYGIVACKWSFTSSLYFSTVSIPFALRCDGFDILIIHNLPVPACPSPSPQPYHR